MVLLKWTNLLNEMSEAFSRIRHYHHVQDKMLSLWVGKINDRVKMLSLLEHIQIKIYEIIHSEAQLIYLNMF